MWIDKISNSPGPIAQPRLNRGQLAEQKCYKCYMCWFYILKNELTNKYYTGSTKNLSERLKQHLRGHTRTTRVLETYQLVYSEKFDRIMAARNREKQIKSYKSKKYIEWLIGQGP